VTVFVDTSAFFAVLDLDADEHRAAVGAFERLIEQQEPLVSHEYVVVEAIALIQRRSGLAPVGRFVDDLLAPVNVEWVDRELHLEAREAMLAGGRRGVSLVDWTSFLVMRRRGISTAFTFDDDFRSQGFDVLPA
jgi:uncharacterized protein